MNEPQVYELILNHITADESRNKDQEIWEDYKRMAYLFLNSKNKSMFEDQILRQFREGKTLEEIMSYNKEQYLQGSSRERNGKMEKTWYDLMSWEQIEAQDNFFDYFFSVKLRHIDLLDIDNYLSYHRENSFENDTEKYFRFLNLAIRKHGHKLLTPEIIETINEWMKFSSAPLAGTSSSEKSKGKLKREPGDNLTALNLQQIALLIHFMQEAKIILKDEYLNKKEAGQAFATLTGYSPDALRQELNPEKFNLSKENLTALQNIITRLNIIIQNKMKKK